MLKYLISCMCLLTISTTTAQLIQSESVIVEKDKNGDYYFVVSAEEKGVLIFRETDDTDKDGVVWDVKVYDTGLKEKRDLQITIDWKYHFKGYEYKKGYLYLLYIRENNEKGDFHVVKIDVDTGDKEFYDIKNELGIELSHLVVSGNSLVLAGYIVNRPTVVLYSFEEEKIMVLPGFFQKRSDIVDLKTNKPDTTFNVLYNDKNIKGENVLKIRTYSHSGQELFDRDIVMEEEFKVLSGTTSNISGDALVVTGTFGASNSTYSQGVYFAKVDKDGQYRQKYYFFSDLKNFFNYLPEKRTKRIKQKIIETKSKGKRYEYKSRLLMHELVESPSGYLLLAELYQPQFDQSVSSSYRDPYYYPYSNKPNLYSRRYIYHPNRLLGTVDVNKYIYYEAVLLEIDKEGKLLWDESFKITDVETTSLEQVVTINKTNDKVNLLYKAKDDLRYKVLESSGMVAHQDTTATILLQDKKLEAKNNPYDNLGEAMHWYDKYFFVWGYTKLPGQYNEQRKKVFYISKVYFE